MEEFDFTPFEGKKITKIMMAGANTCWIGIEGEEGLLISANSESLGSGLILPVLVVERYVAEESK